MSRIRNKTHAIRVCSRILSMFTDAHVIIARGRDDEAVGSGDDTYENSMDIGGDPILCREICKMATEGLRIATGEIDEDDDEDEYEVDESGDDGEETGDEA